MFRLSFLARTVAVSGFCLLSASCSMSRPDRTPIDNNENLPAAHAGRGSPGFCESYARQSAASRQRTSSDSGEGPSGQDMHLGDAAGERAYRRCLAGQTN